MPFDGISVLALTYELSEQLDRARVSKITHVAGSKVFIQMRSARQQGSTRSKLLVIDTSSSGYSMYLSRKPIYNQGQASNFCMLLRKYISNAELIGVSKVKNERIVCLDFRSRNELSDVSSVKLYAELMGRASNVVLVLNDNKIAAALKYSGFSEDNRRVVLPGAYYELPKAQAKIDPFDAQEHDYRLAFSNYSDACVEKMLLSEFSGIGPLMAKQLCFSFFGRENVNISSVSSENLSEFFSHLRRKFTEFKENKFIYIFFCHNSKKGVSCADLQFVPESDKKHFESISEAAEFLAESIGSEAPKTVNNVKINRFVNNNIKRCRKKLEKLKHELSSNLDYNDKKIIGDLIMANLYNIKGSPSSVSLFNWYTSCCTDVNLDTKLSPAENAQRYYKMYSKGKTAVCKITEQIAATESEAEYLESVKNNLELARTFDDIELIAEELIEASYILPARQRKKYKNRIYSPLKFDAGCGFTLFIGRNNLENDWLSFKFAGKNDIWMHVKAVPGSHAILRSDSGNENALPPEETLYAAAVLCAKHSKASASSKAEVDYTLAKYVKKIKDSKPGMVVYKNQKTISVNLE